MVKKLGKDREKEEKMSEGIGRESKLEYRARGIIRWEDGTTTTTVAADRRGLCMRRIYRHGWFSWFALQGS